MRRSVALLLLLSLLPCVPGRAHAAWPPGGILLSTGLNDHITFVRIYPDSADGVAVVMNIGHLTYDFLSYRRILASGDPLYVHHFDVGSPVGVSRDPSGGAFHAFSYAYQLPDPADVFLDRVLADGTLDSAWPLLGLPVGISPVQDLWPLSASDGAGGAYILWNEGYAKTWLDRRQADGGGAPGWPSSGVLLSQRPFELNARGLMPDGAGGVYALWNRSDASGGQVELVLQRVTSAGAVSGGWPAAGVVLGRPTATIDEAISLPFPSGTDHVIVAWLEGSSLYLQRIRDDGAIAAGWPPGGLLVVDPSVSVTGLVLVPDGIGGAYAAWQESGDVRAVRVRENGSVATGWSAGGQSVLDAAAVPGTGFRVTHGDLGGLIVAWDDLRNPDRRQVRARWLLGDGTSDPAQPDSGSVVSEGVVTAYVRGAGPDGGGGAYVVWEDLDDSFYHVHRFYMSRLMDPIPLDVAPAPAQAGLRMSAPRPNPATREVSFTVAIPQGEPVRAELVDLAGRRVREARLEGPGERLVRFAGIDALPAGMYFVRVFQGGVSISDRVAIVH